VRQPGSATDAAAATRRALGPRGVPGLGSLVAYRRDPAQFLMRLRRDHGPVASMRMGPLTVTLAASPSAVRHVLVDRPDNYVRGQLYGQFREVMGSGLLVADTEQWRPHRRVMQPAFTRAAVDAYVPKVVGATARMLDRWEVHAARGEPVDLVAETLRLALGTISSALFAFDVDDRAALVKRVVDESIDVMFPHGHISEMLPGWVPTARGRRVRRNRAVLHSLVDDIVAAPRAPGDGPLLDLIEAARSPDQEPWSTAEVRDELLTVYLAGHETTAVSMLWTLVSLANNPAVREGVRAEVDAVLGGREPVPADLPNLPYTTAVVSESLRMYPPIWLYPRDAVAEDELDGWPVPAGSSVLLSPLVTHRDPELWPSPDAFDPERFLSGVRPERGSYFPFGFGARQCIGNLMATVELQVALAMVVQRTDLGLLGGELMRYGDSVVSLRPGSPVWARPRPRASGASRYATSANGRP